MAKPVSNVNKLSRRLKEEITCIKNMELENMSISYVAKDVKHWRALIIGPPDTPYENGVYKLDIVLKDYPHLAPKVRLITPIYHMNVSPRGMICLELLSDKWNDKVTILEILFAFYDLLQAPAFEDSIRPELAQLYHKNYDEYIREATKHTRATMNRQNRQNRQNPQNQNQQNHAQHQPHVQPQPQPQPQQNNNPPNIGQNQQQQQQAQNIDTDTDVKEATVDNDLSLDIREDDNKEILITTGNPRDLDKTASNVSNTSNASVGSAGSLHNLNSLTLSSTSPTESHAASENIDNVREDGRDDDEHVKQPASKIKEDDVKEETELN